MRTTSDRRAHDRYDVIGALWGVLELPEPATIVDVSPDGILLEAGISPVLDSAQTIRLLVEGELVSVETTVRHARPARDGRHLIGLQFFQAPEAVIGLLEQFQADSQVEVVDAGATRL